MNDVRRFIRYTLPGLVFAIQLIVALGVSDWEKVSAIYKISNLKESLSFFLVGFLASGALGYMFSIFYYALYWWEPIEKKLAIDHKTLFQKLEDKIEIKNADGKPINLNSLSKKEAWSILTRYWFTNYEDYNCIKGINSTIDRLSNIVHGNGTTVVATFMSACTWTFLHYWLSEKFFSQNVIILLLCWFILTLVAFCAYLNSLRFFQSIINSTMLGLLIDQYRMLGQKIEIWYSE